MRVCIIGATGHIDGFLIPMLVRRGHEVAVVTTGRRPVPDGPEWQRVRLLRGEYRRDFAADEILNAGSAYALTVPEFTPQQSLERAVNWMRGHGLL